MEATMVAPGGLEALCARYGAIYPRGRAVVHEGARDSDLYVVMSGTLEVSVWDRFAEAKRVLRTLEPGEIFGEISCFGGLPRSATVTPRDDAYLLRFRRDAAHELIQASPGFAMKIIKTLGDRLRANTETMLAESYDAEPQPGVTRRAPLTIAQVLGAAVGSR